MGTALPASSAMRRLDSGRDAKVLTAACGRTRTIVGGCRLGTGAPAGAGGYLHLRPLGAHEQQVLDREKEPAHRAVRAVDAAAGVRARERRHAAF